MFRDIIGGFVLNKEVNRDYFEFKPLANILKVESENDLCFVFIKGNLIINKNDNVVTIPTWKYIKNLNLNFIECNCIGKIINNGCFALECDQECTLPLGMELVALRECGSILSEELFLIAGRGSQILYWNKTHKFCSKCGSVNKDKEDERAKICSECNFITYPNISPAIIVAVTNREKILLAHNKGFKKNLYSVLAGFVEPGETLESCVKREVFEEVGIQVKNIKYFGNKSWPFPNSLMIGFFAEYDSGEIKVDGIEIAHANWYGKENMPNIPEKTTIARKMMDSFLNR